MPFIRSIVPPLSQLLEEFIYEEVDIFDFGFDELDDAPVPLEPEIGTIYHPNYNYNIHIDHIPLN